jgi:lysophospholipase L1-like esterase
MTPRAYLTGRLCLLILLLGALTPFAAAKPKPAPDHWVATWGTAPVAVPTAKMPATAYIPGAAATTVRQIVHTSLGGDLVRIEFTNALGTDPLTLGEVHVALADKTTGVTTGNISLMTANALTFNGAGSITIPAGAEAVSDPFALKLPAESDLVITMFLPAQTVTQATVHTAGYQTNFFTAGNVVSERSLAMNGATVETMSSWYFLKSVDVKDAPDTGTVVAFGDSITDGYASTPNTNQRWPDLLAERLQTHKATKNLGVVNEGIGGNRILQDGTGPNALSRFDRDVLALPGVRYLIVLEGINDIGHAYAPNGSDPPVTAEQLEAGLSQMAQRAHEHGIKVYAATLTPYMGANYSSAAGEQVREALNTWIRTNTVMDGVIDFDKATESATNPGTFNPADDHGDHLHPDDAGMKAMADAIDLKLFAAPK